MDEAYVTVRIIKFNLTSTVYDKMFVSCLPQSYLTQFNYMGHNSPDPRLQELAATNTTEAIMTGCMLLQQRFGLPVTGAPIHSLHSIVVYRDVPSKLPYKC